MRSAKFVKVDKITNHQLGKMNIYSYITKLIMFEISDNLLHHKQIISIQERDQSFKKCIRKIIQITDAVIEVKNVKV